MIQNLKTDRRNVEEKNDRQTLYFSNGQEELFQLREELVLTHSVIPQTLHQFIRIIQGLKNILDSLWSLK